MNVWGYATSAVSLLVIAANLLWPIPGWLHRQTGRRFGPALGIRIGYVVTAAAVFGASDAGLISITTEGILSVALAVGMFLAFITDDDDHRPRRRRLSGALKRVRSYLAHGVPARRATEGA